MRHLPNGQASVRRRIPIPPKFRSVQQRNTARFELKDAGGCEPVHGSILCFRSCWASTSGWRRDTRERQRAARRASPARGRVGSGMMGDTTTRTGQSRFPGRPLRLRPARGGRAFPSAPLPRRRLLPARSGRSSDDRGPPQVGKEVRELVLLRPADASPTPRRRTCAGHRRRSGIWPVPICLTMACPESMTGNPLVQYVSHGYPSGCGQAARRQILVACCSA